MKLVVNELFEIVLKRKIRESVTALIFEIKISSEKPKILSILISG